MGFSFTVLDLPGIFGLRFQVRWQYYKSDRALWIRGITLAALLIPCRTIKTIKQLQYTYDTRPCSLVRVPTRSNKDSRKPVVRPTG